MIKRTLGDVKSELRRVAGQAGLKADDSRLIDYINLATERLLAKSRTIVGTLHRLKFCQHGGIVALPAKYQRLVQGSVNRKNTLVVGQWYEFMDYGPGQQDTPCGADANKVSAFIDHGESPVIRQSTDKPRLVRVYGYADERTAGVRPKILVKGYDEYGLWVRTDDGAGNYTDGELIEVNGDAADNWATSTKKFSKIDQIVKPVTKDKVEVYFYDADYAKTYLAGRYDSWETNPTFRLYHFPQAQHEVLIHALCKLRFKKVVHDDDPLIIPSLPALRYAMRALAKEDGDEYAPANDLWELAAQTLRDEAREYYGPANPFIDVKTGGPVGGNIAPII